MEEMTSRGGTENNEMDIGREIEVHRSLWDGWTIRIYLKTRHDKEPRNR